MAAATPGTAGRGYRRGAGRRGFLLRAMDHQIPSLIRAASRRVGNQATRQRAGRRAVQHGLYA